MAKKVQPWEKYQQSAIPGESPEDKFGWLIEQSGSVKPKEADELAKALWRLVKEVPELAQSHATAMLSIAAMPATLVGMHKALVFHSSDPKATVERSLEICLNAKAKQKKALWRVRKLILHWYIEQKEEPADRAVFSPFTKGITTKLAKLCGGTLPLVPPYEKKEVKYYSPLGSEEVTRELVYAERYLQAALRGDFSITRKDYDSTPQRFSTGNDYMLLDGRRYMQWGWLESSQRHVAFLELSDDMNLNPNVFESDHHPLEFGYVKTLGDYIKDIK